VFLGGGHGMALLEKHGLPVRGIADVGEVALAIYGRREDGMAALAQRMFGMSLDKTVRRADWLARPLNGVLINYAHRDAELTLLIYRWFQQQFPDVLALHERDILEPRLDDGLPEWLREAFKRATSDPLAVAMEYDFHADSESDVERFAADVSAALETATAPRQINRLFRVAADLGLRPVLPHVFRYVKSPSGLLRASAARTIGQLAEPEEGRSLVLPMKADTLEEVRRAVDSALRDLKVRAKAPVPTTKEEEDTVEETSLGDDSLAVLQQLMQRLQEPG
jgi:hypothetical protein